MQNENCNAYSFHFFSKYKENIKILACEFEIGTRFYFHPTTQLYMYRWYGIEPSHWSRSHFSPARFPEIKNCNKRTEFSKKKKRSTHLTVKWKIPSSFMAIFIFFSLLCLVLGFFSAPLRSGFVSYRSRRSPNENQPNHSDWSSSIVGCIYRMLLRF